MIRKFFNYVVSNFGFENITDFTNSLLHPKVVLMALPIAGISSIVESLFGLQSLTILAFIVLVTLELITGLVGAKVLGKKIESRKFGRFGLKIFVWLTLLFILNSLTKEYRNHEDLFGTMAYGLFTWLHGTLFIYINIEYLISVLENLGTITGKSNDSFINVIKEKLKGFLGNKK
jgi:hypothetical protein